jgi:hypothetical protein
MLKSRSRDELKTTLDRLSDPKFDALFSQLNEARSSARMEMVAFLNEISQSFPNAGLPRRELFLFKFMMDSPAHGGKVLGILRRSPSHDPEVLKYVMSIIQSDASSVSEKALALKYFVLLKSNPGFEAARRSEVFARRLALLEKELKNSIIPAEMDVQEYWKALVKAWGSMDPDTAKRASNEVFGTNSEPVDHANEVKSQVSEPPRASNSAKPASSVAQETASRGKCKGGVFAYLIRKLRGL